jgi:branched-chain amino acid transport system substrate-binding protein
MKDECTTEFGKVGVETVASEAHANAPTDLRAQMTKLLAAKPDAIYLAPIGGGTVPLGIRAGRELGFKGLFMTYTSGDTPDVYNLKLAETGFFFVSHDVPAQAPQAVADAVKAYGGYAGAGYDFGWIVGTVARELASEGKPLSGAAIIERVRARGTVETPVNQYRFKPDGYTTRPLAIFGVANGGRKLVRAFTAQQLD